MQTRFEKLLHFCENAKLEKDVFPVKMETNDLQASSFEKIKNEQHLDQKTNEPVFSPLFPSDLEKSEVFKKWFRNSPKPSKINDLGLSCPDNDLVESLLKANNLESLSGKKLLKRVQEHRKVVEISAATSSHSLSFGQLLSDRSDFLSDSPYMLSLPQPRFESAAVAIRQTTVLRDLKRRSTETLNVGPPRP